MSALCEPDLTDRSEDACSQAKQISPLHLFGLPSLILEFRKGSGSAHRFRRLALTQDNAPNRATGHKPPALAAGGAQLGTQSMDRTDPNERSGREASKSDPVFCPKCAAALHIFIDILDSRNGKLFRLFRCECGEFFWSK